MDAETGKDKEGSNSNNAPNPWSNPQAAQFQRFTYMDLEIDKVQPRSEELKKLCKPFVQGSQYHPEEVTFTPASATMFTHHPNKPHAPPNPQRQSRGPRGAPQPPVPFCDACSKLVRCYRSLTRAPLAPSQRSCTKLERARCENAMGRYGEVRGGAFATTARFSAEPSVVANLHTEN